MANRSDAAFTPRRTRSLLVMVALLVVASIVGGMVAAQPAPPDVYARPLTTR